MFSWQDLLNFYRAKNLIEPNDPPLINLTFENFEEGLEEFINDRELLASYAKRSFEYVSRIHSTESIGMKFKQINNSLGIRFVMKLTNNPSFVKSVLITGVNGLLGSHVANLLVRNGFKVFGTTRPGTKPKIGNIELIERFKF